MSGGCASGNICTIIIVEERSASSLHRMERIRCAGFGARGLCFVSGIGLGIYCIYPTCTYHRKTTIFSHFTRIGQVMIRVILSLAYSGTAQNSPCIRNSGDQRLVRAFGLAMIQYRTAGPCALAGNEHLARPPLFQTHLTCPDANDMVGVHYEKDPAPLV